MYYYRARWYQPGSGRFASVDPLGVRGSDGSNVYPYARGNPVTSTDPLGLETKPRPYCKASGPEPGPSTCYRDETCYLCWFISYKCKKPYPCKICTLQCNDGLHSVSLSGDSLNMTCSGLVDGINNGHLGPFW